MTKKKPKKWVLKGVKMRCPKCKSTENLSRNERVPINTYITVDKDSGRWDWSQTRQSRVAWEFSDYSPDQLEQEWRCHDCDIDFDAPNIKSVHDKGEVAHG